MFEMSAHDACYEIAFRPMIIDTPSLETALMADRKKDVDERHFDNNLVQNNIIPAKNPNRKVF